MYQADEFSMNVVDRSKYPNKWKSLFFNLPMKKLESIKLTCGGMAFFLVAAILTLFTPKSVARDIAFFCCLLLVPFNFIKAFIWYNSKLHIKNGRFRIMFFNFCYYKGSMAELIEVQRLKSWDGSYRVRCQGLSPISGFLLFTDKLPEPFSHLKKVEGGYA